MYHKTGEQRGRASGPGFATSQVLGWYWSGGPGETRDSGGAYFPSNSGGAWGVSGKEGRGRLAARIAMRCVASVTLVVWENSPA